MKKRILAGALSAALVLTLAGCQQTPAESGTPAPTGTTAQGVYTPGTYEATAQGYGGDVTVSMTFDADSITDVAITGDGETPTVGGAALEDLQQQLLDAQSDGIDGVTGATMASNNAKAMMKAILDSGVAGETVVVSEPTAG